MDQTEHGESEVDAVTEISTRVRERCPDAPAERIEHEVSTAFHKFDGQPIREFVPILVERAVIDRLGTRGEDSTFG